MFVQLYHRKLDKLYPTEKLILTDTHTQCTALDNEELQKALESGYQPRLVLIDAGLVTELNETNQTNFVDLFTAVAEGNGTLAARLMVERSRGGRDVSLAQCRDYFGFESKMAVVVRQVQQRTFRLAHVQIGEVLGTVLSLVREHHVKIESDFTNLVVSIMILEGLGRQMNPDLDLFEAARPLLRQRRGSSEFYFSRGGMVLKLIAFLEARYWLLLREHDEQEFAVLDTLLFNNF